MTPRVRLTNQTDEPITLHTKHVIPANGYLDVEKRVVDNAGRDPWLAGQLRRRNLVVGEIQEAAKPEAITRETVAKMRKPDLQEYLAFHGAETTGTADELRARLTDVMFCDLDYADDPADDNDDVAPE